MTTLRSARTPGLFSAVNRRGQIRIPAFTEASFPPHNAGFLPARGTNAPTDGAGGGPIGTNYASGINTGYCSLDLSENPQNRFSLRCGRYGVLRYGHFLSSDGNRP